MARADKSVTAVTDQQKEEQAEQWRTSGARSATMTNGYDPSRAAMNQRQTSDRAAMNQRQTSDRAVMNQRQTSDRAVMNQRQTSDSDEPATDQ